MEIEYFSSIYPNSPVPISLSQSFLNRSPRNNEVFPSPFGFMLPHLSITTETPQQQQCATKLHPILNLWPERRYIVSPRTSHSTAIVSIPGAGREPVRGHQHIQPSRFHRMHEIREQRIIRYRHRRPSFRSRCFLSTWCSIRSQWSQTRRTEVLPCCKL